MKQFILFFILLLGILYFYKNYNMKSDIIECNSENTKKNIVKDLKKLSSVSGVNMKIVKIYDGLFKKDKESFKKICYIKLAIDNSGKIGKHTFIKDDEYIIEYIIENNSSSDKIKSYFKIK